MATASMTEASLELVARRFRILGEPFRLRLLQQLEQGEHTVGELVDSLEASQSNVSKHLQLLYDAGLVTRRRDGNSIFYSIGDPIVFELCRLVCRSEAEKSRRDLKELTRPLGRRNAR
jgi:DNA-binding transcriptional ArsR family regulator